MNTPFPFLHIPGIGLRTAHWQDEFFYHTSPPASVRSQTSACWKPPIHSRTRYLGSPQLLWSRIPLCKSAGYSSIQKTCPVIEHWVGNEELKPGAAWLTPKPVLFIFPHRTPLHAASWITFSYSLPEQAFSKLYLLCKNFVSLFILKLFALYVKSFPWIPLSCDSIKKNALGFCESSWFKGPQFLSMLVLWDSTIFDSFLLNWLLFLWMFNVLVSL